ncbi:MAG TPA: hypothetical protein VF120_03025 [Ktedonobacterales bacterium]
MQALGTLGLYAVAALAGVVILALLARSLRGNMDLVGLHARELVRHAIAGVLLLGTLAGTTWTFSDGKLSLDGGLETLVSVGGVAAALEAGAIFFGLAIQQLEMRIKTARRKEQQDEYRSRRALYYRWFAAILAISFLSNLCFRWQALGAGFAWDRIGNDFAVMLVSTAPIVLITVFTIILQPLAPDYAEMRRQATQRGLVILTRSSQQVMLRHLRDMGRGRKLDAESMHQLAFAASFMRMDAVAGEQQALDYAIQQGTGATIVEGSADEYLSSADVERLYDVPRRTAQLWVSTAQGRKRATKGRAWLAPASAIYSAHGVPQSSATPELKPPRKRNISKPSARSAEEAQEGAQPGATDAQTAAVIDAEQPQFQTV